MVILMPVGQEGKLRRFPYVTVGLIIFMTLLHMFSYSSVKKQIEKHEQAKQEYALIIAEFQAKKDERRNIDIGSMDMPDLGYNLLHSMKAMKNYDERKLEEIETAMKTGKLYPLDSPEYRQWIEAKQAVQDTKSDILFHRFGFVPTDSSLLTAISSMFFHGDFWHLLFNVIFLWIAGCMLENTWGHIIFGLAYILSGIAAVYSHGVMLSSSSEPAIGASGAIAGLMGAYLVCHFFRNIRVFWLYFFGFTFRHGFLTVPAYILLIFWFLVQVFWVLMIGGAEETVGIAFWAHLGGFGFGIILAYLIRLSGFEEPDLEILEEEEEQAQEELSQPHPKLFEGLEAFQHNRKDDAFRILTEVVETDPASLEANETLSLLYAEKGMVSKARFFGEKAIRTYLQKRSPDLAYDLFEKLGTHFPDVTREAELLFQLARSLERSKQNQQAAVVYHHLALTLPKDILSAKAAMKAGTMFREWGELKKAIECYKCILSNATDPTFKKEALLKLAQLQKEMKQ